MDYFRVNRDRLLKKFQQAQGYAKESALHSIVRYDAWQADQHRATVHYSLALLIESKVPVDRIRRVIRPTKAA